MAKKLITSYDYLQDLKRWLSNCVVISSELRIFIYDTACKASLANSEASNNKDEFVFDDLNVLKTQLNHLSIFSNTFIATVYDKAYTCANRAYSGIDISKLGD